MAPPPASPKVRYDDIEPSLATGDVLFFHGSEASSLRIEHKTHSEFSHAAMVIRPDQTKPPLIWQAGPEAMIEDYFTKTKHAGAQLSDLREMLTVWAHLDPSYTGYLRQLTFKRSPAFETVALWASVGLDGTPFPALQDMLKEWKAGHKHQTIPDQTFFCSELVAHTFMMMGLLPFDPPANAYAPGDFSTQRQPLRWQRGAALGPQYQLEPPSDPTPPAGPGNM